MYPASFIAIVAIVLRSLAISGSSLQASVILSRDWLSARLDEKSTEKPWKILIVYKQGENMHLPCFRLL